MVRIRLMRMGMKGQPSYRVVITDARSPRDGRFIENIGWYNPRTEPSTIHIDAERARHWLSVGAQPSVAVVSLLKRAGISPKVGGAQQGAVAGAASATPAGSTPASSTPAAATPAKTGNATGRASRTSPAASAAGATSATPPTP